MDVCVVKTKEQPRAIRTKKQVRGTYKEKDFREKKNPVGGIHVHLL
jgi:hypothetical protein